MTSSSASLTATRGRTTLVVASSAAVAVLVVRYFQRRARARAQKSVERVKTLLPQNKPLVRTLRMKRNDTNEICRMPKHLLAAAQKVVVLTQSVTHSFVILYEFPFF